MFESTPRPFSTPTNPRPRVPAVRPGLGQQVNGWVDGVAQASPTFQAPANPEDGMMYASGAPQGVAVGEPHPAAVSNPAPDLSVNPNPTYGTTTVQDPPSVEGGPRHIGGGMREVLSGQFGDWREKLGQFQSLDQNGKAAMINDWLAANPQFEQYRPRIEAFTQNGRFFGGNRHRPVNPFVAGQAGSGFAAPNPPVV